MSVISQVVLCSRVVKKICELSIKKKVMNWDWIHYKGVCECSYDCHCSSLIPLPWPLQCMPAQLSTVEICPPSSESFLEPPKLALPPHMAGKKCQRVNIALKQGLVAGTVQILQLPCLSDRITLRCILYIGSQKSPPPQKNQQYIQFFTVTPHLIAYIGLDHLTFLVSFPHFCKKGLLSQILILGSSLEQIQTKTVKDRQQTCFRTENFYVFTTLGISSRERLNA